MELGLTSIILTKEQAKYNEKRRASRVGGRKNLYKSDKMNKKG